MCGLTLNLLWLRWKNERGWGLPRIGVLQRLLLE